MNAPVREIRARYAGSTAIFRLRSPGRLAAMLLIPLAAFATAAIAQVSAQDLRLPISLDADSTDYDGKSSMLRFKGLRLSQGNFGVQADEGRATQLDFEDSRWHFSGNVIIDTENGHIECETADLNFANHELQLATITGSPASFEIQRPDSADSTYAEADQLTYNFELGIVEFFGDATITEGGNQISSSYLVYNIAEQKINAQSAGIDGERVKITYTPRQDPGESLEGETDDATSDGAVDTPDAASDSADGDPNAESESANDGADFP